MSDKATTPTPTPAAMEAARLAMETLSDDLGTGHVACGGTCWTRDTLSEIIQTHACDPSYRAGQIAGLEWAAGIAASFGGVPTTRDTIRAEIARLKGEGGE